MCSQSKGIGSANISASMCGKIRTIPALLHCASRRRDNEKAELRDSESANLKPLVSHRDYEVLVDTTSAG